MMTDWNRGNRVLDFGASTSLDSCNYNWSFSQIKDNGRIDTDYLAEFFQYLSNDCGFTYFRDLTYLVYDNITKNFYNPNPTHNRFFLPYIFENGTYNYDKLNQIFFDNKKEKIKGCVRVGMKYHAVLGDRCHHRLSNAPTQLNNKGKKGFDWYNWDKYRQAYIAKYLDTIKEAFDELEKEGYIFPIGMANKPIVIQIENEPMHKKYALYACYIIEELLNRGYTKWQIDLGASFWDLKKNNAYQKTKRVFRDLKNRALRRTVEGKNTDEWIMERGKWWEQLKWAMRRFRTKLYDAPIEENDWYINSIHGYPFDKAIEFTIETAITSIGYRPRLDFSNDGWKPKYSELHWYSYVKGIFERMLRRWNGRGQIAFDRWGFEVFFNGDFKTGESSDNDKMGFRGLTNAYYDTFGEYPPNYGKYPKIMYPPEKPVEPPVTPPEEPPIEPPVPPIEPPVTPPEGGIVKKILAAIWKFIQKYWKEIVIFITGFILGIKV